MKVYIAIIKNLKGLEMESENIPESDFETLCQDVKEIKSELCNGKKRRIKRFEKVNKPSHLRKDFDTNKPK